jgi:hypothetical protein
MNKFIFLILYIIPIVMKAQDPASTKWKQINTNDFQLIFPENYDSTAKRIGTMLQIENEFETHSMKIHPAPISIILHNQLTMSNSWVALGPRRMELFHTPPQSNSTMEWNATLALHEYRHVIQYEMLKESFAGKILFILMGDAGLGLKSATSPEWFYEGDAVATETALSKAGRGRSPDFSKDLRAQLLDKKKYSYAKAVCGSYKDYVPNHYILGYHLISYGRFVWNSELWRIAHQKSGNTFGFTPFSTGIKRVTGMRKYQFYNLAMSDLKTYWLNQFKNQKLSNYETRKTLYNKSFTNYTYPYQLSDKSIVALKNGMSDIPTIVKINTDGTETVIKEVTSMIDGNPINTNGDQVIWVEEFPDLRWTMRSYADIMLYDINSNTTKRITNKQHFYAPDISPDGTKIVCVEVTEKATYKLVILDAKNGAIIKRYAAPNNEFILTPRWGTNNSIALILQGKEGKILSTFNLETEHFKNYSEPSFTDISEPFFYKKYLFYTSEHNGINNEIYSLDTITKNCFQITNSRLGSRFASITPYKELLYSSYSADGYTINSKMIDERDWVKSDFSNPPTDSLVLGLLKDEKGIPNLYDSTQNFKYTIKPYHKILHIFSPYAWGIGINTNNPDSKSNQNDISLLSQDKLGTFAFEAGYKYDYIGTKKWYANLHYTGIYPIIELDFEKGTNGVLLDYQEKQKILNYDTLFHQDGKLFSQIITFPFNISTSNYSRFFEISAINRFDSYGDQHVDFKSKNQYHFIGSNYNYTEVWHKLVTEYSDYVNIDLFFSNIKSSPYKNILPTWGQSLEAGFIKNIPLLKTIDNTVSTIQSLPSSNLSSQSAYVNFVDRIYVKGKFYLPSFVKHHSLWISGGYTQLGKTKDTNYAYNPVNTGIPFARGYINYSGVNYKCFGSFSANYTFPLINPDFAIQSLLYLKRIQANIFIDHTITNKSIYSLTNGSTTFTSFGVEIISENRILNCPNLPLQLGFRTTSIDPELGQTRRRIITEILFHYSL